jgi:selenophosphate synthase
VLRASGVAAVLDPASIPVIDGVRRLVEEGAVAGGSQRNLDDTHHVDFTGVSPTDSLVFCDAQTSGGLLLAVSPDALAGVTARLGPEASWVIGTIVAAAPEGSPLITFSGAR